MDAFCSTLPMHLIRALTLFVCSEDTDVFIMSLAFSNEIGASLFIKNLELVHGQRLLTLEKLLLHLVQKCAEVFSGCIHSLGVIL